mgnify:CR=1 FL=1
MTTIVEASGLEVKFEKLLAAVVKEIPTDNTGNVATDPRKQVEARLRKEWESPKIKEMEFCLQKRFSQEEARHLLFFPDEKQVEFYVSLILDPPDGAPSNHPQKILQVPFISMLYLVHSNNWKSMVSFISAGGLRSLTTLLAHKNIYLRSQVIDIVLKVTSSPYMDWFEKPKDSTQQCLHTRLLELTQWGLVKNLLANSPQTLKKDLGNIPPMASYFSLQILAFYLSWTRKLYTKDGTLSLSKEILNTLRVWTTAATGVEEKELITKLYEDFSRFPPADDAEGHNVNIKQTGGALTDVKEVEEDTRSPTERANDAKTTGNTHFKKKEYEKAIQCYNEAISLDNTRAAFYGNVAAAWLQLAKLDKKERNETKVSCVEKCIENCKAAIQRDPTYAKAFFRYAQALALVGKKPDALEKCKEAKTVVSVEEKSKPPKAVLKQLSALKSQIQKLANEIKDTMEDELVQENGWKAPISEPTSTESLENDLDASVVAPVRSNVAPRREAKDKKKVSKIAAALLRRKKSNK